MSEPLFDPQAEQQRSEGRERNERKRERQEGSAETLDSGDGRVGAEKEREASEEGRVDAEEGRVEAEKLREEGREASEQGRVSGEAGRETAAASQAEAEEGRVKSDNRRHVLRIQPNINSIWLAVLTVLFGVLTAVVLIGFGQQTESQIVTCIRNNQTTRIPLALVGDQLVKVNIGRAKATKGAERRVNEDAIRRYQMARNRVIIPDCEKVVPNADREHPLGTGD